MNNVDVFEGDNEIVSFDRPSANILDQRRRRPSEFCEKTHDRGLPHSFVEESLQRLLANEMAIGCKRIHEYEAIEDDDHWAKQLNNAAWLREIPCRGRTEPD